MRFTYEDKMPNTNVGEGYNYPNENYGVLCELADKAKFKKAASIASGGEVPLFVVLPRANSVMAIDHSYNSSRWVCVKALLLEHNTTQQIRKLLKDIAGNAAVGEKLFLELGKELPPELHRLATKHNSYSSYYYEPKPVEKASWAYVFGYFDFRGWALYMNSIPDAMLDAARERLDNLTVIHGDLRKLEEYGKFDFLYASNAPEHYTYEGGKMLGFDPMVDLVKRRGYVLHTYNSRRTFPEVWKEAALFHGRPKENGSMGNSWHYRLSQYLTKPQVEKMKPVQA